MGERKETAKTSKDWSDVFDRTLKLQAALPIRDRCVSATFAYGVLSLSKKKGGEKGRKE